MTRLRSNWLRQHGSALGNAFAHLWKTPGNFLLNVLVVSIALTLPFAGLTILENVRPVSQQLSVQPEITVFMRTETSREAAVSISTEIERIAREGQETIKLEFVQREKALAGLKEKSGLEDVIATLGGNPLPDAYIVSISGLHDREATKNITPFAEKLKSINGVETVQIDSAWAERLAALLRIMRLALLFLAIILGTAVVAVVFNTIRLQVMNQREEIEVSRMVGATDAFICRPFYYTGALLGVTAGLVALATVALALNPLNGAIAEFARLYASEFRLTPLSLASATILLSVSVALGCMGAFLSVGRHLARLR